MKKFMLILLIVMAGGACFAMYAFGRSGCCSRHGGVSHCGKSGYFICADGTQSPGCRCR